MTAIALITLFAQIDQSYSTPSGILSAICWVESRHKPKVKNNHDGLLRNGVRAYDPSIGLCQVKLSTAQEFEPDVTAEQLTNPRINVRIAAKYLQWQLSRYGSIPCAVAAYNAGSCRFNKHGEIKNRKYAHAVLDAWLESR